MTDSASNKTEEHPVQNAENICNILKMSGTEKCVFNQGEFKETLLSNLLELSADLNDIFNQGILSDSVLLTNDRFIRCHKDILISRSIWFSLKFHTVNSYDTKSLKVNENDQILDVVLAYIYTGNLKLLESMNISLADLRNAANKYGLSSLSKVLTDVIKFENSADRTKRIEFLWKAKIDCNTSVICDCSAMENFSLDGSDKWNLELQPFFLEDGSCLVGVYLTRSTLPETPMIVHVVKVTVYFEDVYGTRELSFKGEFIFSEDSKYIIAEISPEFKKLEDSGILIRDDTITLACELIVCGKLGNSGCFKLSDNFQKHISNELHKLSQDMYEMMKMKRNCDTSIQLKGCSLLRVHSYILLGRSRIPTSCLGRLGDITGFESAVWTSFIFFLYTGQTRYLDDHMRTIYCALKKLSLPKSTQKYSNILARNLNVNNAFAILSDAIKYEDAHLMLCAAKFLACQSSTLSEPGMWISIAKETVTKEIVRNQ